MSTCGLTYDNQFEVNLREHSEFNVDTDFNALMTCAKSNQLYVICSIGTYGSPDSDVLFEQGVLGSMYVHAKAIR